MECIKIPESVFIDSFPKMNKLHKFVLFRKIYSPFTHKSTFSSKILVKIHEKTSQFTLLTHTAQSDRVALRPSLKIDFDLRRKKEAPKETALTIVQ
jgi:hypothetical protein